MSRCNQQNKGFGSKIIRKSANNYKNYLFLYEESSISMTRQRNLTQVIQRVRIIKINDEVSKSFPPSLRNTYRNELFNLGDCGTENNKIFISLTPNNMFLCNNIHNWYVDGTFDKAPSLFKQVFTQHVI
jgi:hypothetical protein